MSKTNRELIEDAQKAISAVFTDVTIDRIDTIESLESLKKYIDERISLIDGSEEFHE